MPCFRGVPAQSSDETSLPRAHSVTTAECVRFLSDPVIYGASCDDVEVRETSKSWVFLTPTTVYKLKKPIENHFQDLRTVPARLANCQIEVTLNRRLAPDIYLGTVAITRDANGVLALNGSDNVVVDWLVQMRRLPEARMLDQVILRQEESKARIGHQLSKLAVNLVEFYGKAMRPNIAPQDYVTHFENEQATSRAVFNIESFDLGREWLNGLLRKFDETLELSRPLLEQRVSDGRVVEGHGDLRPEHVCLVDPPVVIDCLEFSPRLRIVDPFDELVFLGLECELIGAPWIADHLIGECESGLKDRPPEQVLSFYKAYRAFLRARQSLAHLLVPKPREPEKWIPKARGYLAIAENAMITLANR